MIKFALEKFIQFLHYLKLSFFNSDFFFHLNVLFRVGKMLPIQTRDHRKLLLSYFGCSQKERLYKKLFQFINADIFYNSAHENFESFHLSN